jgi:hypothetical protein
MLTSTSVPLLNPSVRAVPRPGAGARLVVFGLTHHQYRARTRRRSRLLSMAPLDPAAAAPPEQHLLDRRLKGYYWEFLRPDDDPLMVRARDFPDAASARADARHLFDVAEDLELVLTRESTTGHLGWWLTLDGEVVLVPARVWRASQRHELLRDVRRVTAALATMPAWGEYEEAAGRPSSRGRHGLSPRW